MARKRNETLRLLVAVFIGMIFGFLIGASVSLFSVSKLIPEYIPASMLPIIIEKSGDGPKQNETLKSTTEVTLDSGDGPKQNQTLMNTTAVTLTPICVHANPRGAELLPPGIIESESDYYIRRLWGLPSEDLTLKPKYLVAFTVGFPLRHNIDAAVKKFSDNFTILLFHYDGRVNEWDEFEWSKKAIHISAPKQAKWWYAKRFLQPDIVAPYDFIFIWDEDLGLEHFNAEKYIDLVKKHGLEISQPAIQNDKGLTWQLTKKRDGVEVHNLSDEGRCKKNPLLPPCAAFVEIMAPVFSRAAWRCMWHLIQNDLVHGYGLDFAVQKCVKPPAHEKIGIVDAQWVIHKRIPSLGNQGVKTDKIPPWRGVRIRSETEWKIFNSRLQNAELEQAKKNITGSL